MKTKRGAAVCRGKLDRHAHRGYGSLTWRSARNAAGSQGRGLTPDGGPDGDGRVASKRTSIHVQPGMYDSSAPSVRGDVPIAAVRAAGDKLGSRWYVSSRGRASRTIRVPRRRRKELMSRSFARREVDERASARAKERKKEGKEERKKERRAIRGSGGRAGRDGNGSGAGFERGRSMRTVPVTGRRTGPAAASPSMAIANQANKGGRTTGKEKKGREGESREREREGDGRAEELSEGGGRGREGRGEGDGDWADGVCVCLRATGMGGRVTV
ncbi:hypothetical protein Mp_7g11450 [Marchantia polymorpha subsp. ruderalis]|uniref:Uncharacterized protein n=2 Tax=Marchantia polymorpha TaxID=3197 RepID=A0AAF6BYF1_MARPO|nr:hypothetical protein MARPO_0003s0159 [Marchantia polymorpha]BBN17035.1 hypothetical protein Mp_7g11450 [Marchantia polymorpha subsp. ruderalis]|eukprot:PTQ49272.1 hypothetical protein MARPO_0003s0159 [Marchantia polymorpha]